MHDGLDEPSVNEGALRTARMPSADASASGADPDLLPNLERRQVALAIMSRTSPGVHGGAGLTFDALWTFFLETNFLYAQKRETIDVDRVRATLTQLFTKPNDLLHAALVTNGDRIQAHTCGVWAYRRTMLVQHLAARFAGKHERSYGARVSIGLVEYLSQRPELAWDKLWYRPANRWPDRAFGDFVRAVDDPMRAYLERLTVMVARDSQPPAGSHLGAPRVRTADDRDAARIEAHFLEAGDTARIEVEDLSRDGLTLDILNVAYGQLGLERRREVWVVDRPGSRSFALLEISSPGLNLSELTNTFRVFGPSDDRQDLDLDDQTTLTAFARGRYRQLGYSQCVGLADQRHRTAFERSGFVAVKEYMGAAWHHSLHPRLLHHLKEIR